MSIKLAIKNIVATISYHLGLFEIANDVRTAKNNACVLMYHRVLGENVNSTLYIQPGMYVNAATFRWHVAFLKKKYTILSLVELVDRIDAGKSISDCCAITFDDGWLDNFIVAFPILQEFQVPATIFLATRFIGTDKLFWPEELSFYLSQSAGRSALKDNKKFLDFLDNIKQPENQGQFLDNAISKVKTWKPEQRSELLKQLRSAFSAKQPDRVLMNWDETRQMQATGLVDFGAHTANHVILDQISLVDVENEVAKSRKDIEKNLGVSPDFFAYPNGNYNTDIQSIIKHADFRGAVTTRKGRLGKSTPPYEIPRIGIHEDVSRTIPLLLARILFKGF